MRSKPGKEESLAKAEKIKSAIDAKEQEIRSLQSDPDFRTDGQIKRMRRELCAINALAEKVTANSAPSAAAVQDDVVSSSR